MTVCVKQHTNNNNNSNNNNDVENPNENKQLVALLNWTAYYSDWIEYKVQEVSAPKRIKQEGN